MEKAHGVLLLLIFTLFAGSAVWLKLALSGGDGSGHAIKTPAWLSPRTRGWRARTSCLTRRGRSPTPQPQN